MSQTSDRYARALFELVKEHDDLEAVQVTMTKLRTAIIHSEDFRYFLSNPLLSYEEQCVVFKALFEDRIPGIVYKFLLFLTYKNRLDILKDVIESFDGMYLTSTQQMRAYVTTVSPIRDDDKAFISQHLQEKFHRQTIISWNLNPSLIGGFRILAQGEIYDYSFKNQLNHFLQQTIQPV